MTTPLYRDDADRQSVMLDAWAMIAAAIHDRVEPFDAMASTYGEPGEMARLLCASLGANVMLVNELAVATDASPDAVIGAHVSHVRSLA